MKKVKSKRNSLWLKEGMLGTITDEKWEDNIKLYLVEFESVGKRIWLQREEFDKLV